MFGSERKEYCQDNRCQVNINGKLMMRTMIRSFFQVARNLQARQLLEKPTIFSDSADENVHSFS